MSGRCTRWFVVALLVVAGLSIPESAWALGGGDSSSTAGVPIWAFWLQVMANALTGAEMFALLFGVYQLWARREERRSAESTAAALALKAANYQAWAVVNTAQGKGGSGGRIDALQDLNHNKVSLAGVRLDGAWLEGIQLPGAQLNRASFREANLQGANLEGANLEGVDLTDTNLTGADLRGAFLKGAFLKGANLGTADLRGAELGHLHDWREMKSASYLNIEGVRHAPPGFRDWALEAGAVEGTAKDEGEGESGSEFSSLFRTVQYRRQVGARITRKGLRLLSHLDAPVTEIHRRQLGHLSHEQLRTLIDFLAQGRAKPTVSEE